MRIAVRFHPSVPPPADLEPFPGAALARLLVSEWPGAEGEVHCILTGAAELEDLNRRFRGIDSPTDVLAFPYDPEVSGGSLGDVFVSLSHAEEQAGARGEPVAREQLLPGAVLRGLIVGVIVLLIAMLFTPVRIPHPLVTLSTVLLGATIFSLAGFVNAVYAKKFDDIAIVPTFILTPLTYLGGVFYTIKLLPEWAQGISHANPILYMVNAFRYGFLGVSDVNVGLAYSIMVAAAIILYVSCVWLLQRGVGTRE